MRHPHPTPGVRFFRARSAKVSRRFFRSFHAQHPRIPNLFPYQVTHETHPPRE
jgi:hypothetical protein